MFKDHMYFGLDIGSKRIKACAMKGGDPNQMELVGVFEADTYGFQNASVKNLGELSECIHGALEKLSEKVGSPIKEITVGIGGSLVNVRPTNIAIPLTERGSKVITHRDIEKVNKHAQLLSMKVEEDLMHNLPQSYRVDDDVSVLNPVGLHGRKLGVESLMVFINSNRMRDITKAVHQAGYEVKEVLFSSYEASQVVLDEKMRTRGCALIDIGSGSTGVLIFQEGKLKFFDHMTIGGDDFTYDIAKGLDLSFGLAEEIKKSYAVASRADRQHQEEILVKREEGYLPVKREIIYRAIEPRITRLVEGIQSSLRKSGLYEQLNDGVVIVGGGALLPGLIEHIDQSNNIPAHQGKVKIHTGKHLSKAALFAAVIGLAFSASQKIPSSLAPANGSLSWRHNILGMMRELYQEYF